MRRYVRLLAVATMLVATACAGRPDRLVIGMALSREYHAGVRQACDEINRAGGVNGIELQVIGHDWAELDLYDPRDAPIWAQRFAAIPDLISVIGHSDSPSSLSAAPFYNRAELPHIVTIATNPAIRDIGPWTYQICLTDEHQGMALAEHAVTQWLKKRFAIFYVDDDYGRQLAAVVSHRLKDLGAEVLASVPHRNAPQKEDRQLIVNYLDQLQSNGFNEDSDCFVILTRNVAAAWILNAIAERPGLSKTAITGEAAALVRVATTADRLGFDLRAPLFFVSSETDAKATAFSKKFRNLWGWEPDYGAALAYDAVHLVARAATIGGANRQGVRRGLEALAEAGSSIDGVAGSFTMRADRGANRTLVIGEVRHGQFKELS